MKTKKIFYLLSIYALLLYFKTIPELKGQVRPMATTELKKTVENATHFAFDIYGQIAREEGNIVLSPYSITTAMAITYLAAKKETETEIAGTLHFPSEKEKMNKAFQALGEKVAENNEEVKTLIANAVWINKSFSLSPEYKELIREYYDASLLEVNFKSRLRSSRKTINKWVAKHTDNKITGLLKPEDIDPTVELIITNAVFFKGAWENPFDAEKTEKDIFYIDEKNTCQVDFMNSNQDAAYNYANVKNTHIIEMPYKNHTKSMLIVMPGAKNNLQSLEKSLSTGLYHEWLVTLRPKKMQLSIPKFHASKRTALNKTLKTMGMPLAFTEEADLSGFTGGNNGLFISNVIHQANIRVDEKGAEATAATAVITSRSMNKANKLVINRPFIFIIKDNQTHAILFIGRINKPEAN